MSGLISKYLSIALISYKNHTVYFYDMIGGFMVFAMRIVIIGLLLKAIYDYGDADLIENYSLIQLVTALVFTQSIAVAKGSISREISQDVKSGKISVYMINPISYIRYKFFENLSTFAINIGLSIIIGITIIFVMFGTIQTSILGVFAGLVLSLGGIMISYRGYTMMGLLAFFTEDSESFKWIYSKLDLIFGGNILPLPFLPEFLSSIAYISPFAYGGYTAGLMFSAFEYGLFIRYISMQFIWIVIIIAICTRIYHIGTKKININGG